MKKGLVLLLMILCLAAAFPLTGSAAASAQEEQAEWTVLFYMCGSDLESRYGYATQNLKEIAGCSYPRVQTSEILTDLGELPEHAGIPFQGRVNVLIETGGCRQWHAEALGMQISSTALQRWRYEGYIRDEAPDGFILEETLPLQSMAAPETLADFLRWGAEHYPAKKYALVLWDHGGGSQTGIFIDELFDNAVMNLTELKTALRDGGVHLEAAVFDACLMANLETAYAIAEHANWMIASEEVVAGEGTAVGDWLQQLYIDAAFDGEWLGRWICDMTQIKYANESNEQAQMLLTWSVIDLSRVPILTRMFDLTMKQLGKIYAQYPGIMSYFSKYVINVEHYGDSEDSMRDLASLFYLPEMSTIMSEEVHKKLLNALKETVVYSLRGPGRSSARGLSFCYAVNFDLAELDAYAPNCPSPYYLAFLDAISPWTAPDWVYEKAERLPELEELPQYQVTAKKVTLTDGTPALTFDEGCNLGAGQVCFNMYRRDEESGDFISLGTMPAFFDEALGETGVYYAYKPWLWPALEGQHVSSYVIGRISPGAKEYLGSIPLLINTEKWYLRYGFFLEENRYVVYGLWDGYETNSRMFNRNVKSLAQFAKQEYVLVYPVYADDYIPSTDYRRAEPRQFFRAMQIDSAELPKGTYYLQYVVYDMFMRQMPLAWIPIQWDGSRLTLAEGAQWEGEQTLNVPDNYWK